MEMMWMVSGGCYSVSPWAWACRPRLPIVPIWINALSIPKFILSLVVSERRFAPATSPLPQLRHRWALGSPATAPMSSLSPQLVGHQSHTIVESLARRLHALPFPCACLSRSVGLPPLVRVLQSPVDPIASRTGAIRLHSLEVLDVHLFWDRGSMFICHIMCSVVFKKNIVWKFSYECVISKNIILGG
jgi:hypothetical protein